MARLRKQKEEKGASTVDTRWDRKQGAPKDGGMAREVEKSSHRYSASEEGEQKRSPNKE